MADTELDSLVRQNRVVAGSRVDLARSPIAAAVRTGAPRPDIGTVDALQRTLLAATSIACSDSASGVYLTSVVFPRLGVADALQGKIAIIPAEPVGAVVARGAAEIGFQTLSALLPVPGIDVIGVLPAELQKPTVFSAAIAAGAAQPDAARDLITYLRSAAAVSAIASAGMEPL